MKKGKIFGVACALILCAISMFSLTACGVGVPKGDRVTEEGWRNAIEKTSKVTNYTMEMSLDVKSSVSGTVWEREYGEEKTTSTDITGKASVSAEGLYLYDEGGNKSYAETKTVLDGKGTTDGEKEKEYYKSVNKEYYEYSGKTGEQTRYWVARYSSEKEKSTEGRSEEENYWRARETGSFSANPISRMFGDTLFYETDDESDKAKSITELYDKFTFSGGKYTATLYRNVSIQDIVNERLKCTVTISFDGDENCVIGLGIKTEGEDSVNKVNEYDVKYSYKGESAYSITKINDTDVSKKVKKDITKAIDKAKREKEK